MIERERGKIGKFPRIFDKKFTASFSMFQIHYLDVLVENGGYVFVTTDTDRNNLLPDIKAFFNPF